MDHRAEDGRSIAAGRQVQENGGPGVRGAPRQTHGGPDANSGVLEELHFYMHT